MEPLIRKTVILLRNASDWVIAQLFFAVLFILKLFPAKGAIWFCAEAARGLGMWYPRTKMARENIKRAFPEKSDEEVEEILKEMWANLGRVAAEYVYLDQVFDVNAEDPAKGQVEFEGMDNFQGLQKHDGPAICFTAHMGNWELLPIASAVSDVHITALFRPPNNRYIAERVLSARKTAMGHLVPSKAGASWALAKVMDENGIVGVLVDQFFYRGIEVDFLERKTLASPLLAKLAQQYDCPVYPCRCIRLEDGRFRISVEPPMDIPMQENGAIDQIALTQKVNDVVSRWITEYPEQWLWLHKRWRPYGPASSVQGRKAEKKRASKS